MGDCFSRPPRTTNVQATLASLNQAIAEMNRKIDQNKDGFVTKEEMIKALDTNKDGLVSAKELDTFVNERLKDLRETLKDREDEISKLNNKISELQKINLQQKNLLQQRESEVNNLSSTLMLKTEDVNHLNETIKTFDIKDGRLVDVSHDIVYNYIDNKMKGAEHNIKGFPDFLEKPIKSYITFIILDLIKASVKSASVEWADHVIGVSIVPNLPKSDSVAIQHEHVVGNSSNSSK